MAGIYCVHVPGIDLFTTPMLVSAVDHAPPTGSQGAGFLADWVPQSANPSTCAQGDGLVIGRSFYLNDGAGGWQHQNVEFTFLVP